MKSRKRRYQWEQCPGEGETNGKPIEHVADPVAGFIGQSVKQEKEVINV